MTFILNLTVAAILDAIDGLFADMVDSLRDALVWAHRTAAHVVGGE